MWKLSFLLSIGSLLSAQAIYLDRARLEAAYPKHEVLVDRGEFRVMAIGREKDGEAEIHARETDVVYFVDGRATLLTGGKLRGARETAAGETRGTGMEGGERRELKAGDVITIPNGVAHQFANIDAPCRYFLLKVKTSDGGKPSVLTSLMKGGPLASGDGYKVSGSHRDKDGIVEVHARDTDIMFFVRGTATLVTGGKVVDGESAGPEEVRGGTITGGVRQAVKPGDAVVVPNTTPHLFVEVRGPLDYFVVKVRPGM